MLDLFPQAHWYLWKAWEYPGVHRLLRELRHESTLPDNEWRAVQTAKLVRLLVSARRYVPYYQEVFEQVGFDPEAGDVVARLSQLPVLTKDLLQEHATRLLSSQCDRRQLIANATGGSTGTPVSFFQDRFYRTQSLALVTYARGWWGVRPYDRTAVVWGADRELSQQSLRDRFYRWRSRKRMLDAFRMNELEVDRFISMLKRWRPPFLLGYASALEALAKEVAASDLGGHRFRAICSSAETLSSPQRELLETVFQSPVFDFYGSREVSSLAAECPEERRLHAISTWRYLEIVDGQGQPLPHGKVGYIAVTDMSNHAMPFIRYVNGDVGSIDSDPCACGRPHPVLTNLLGRSSDLIRKRNGEIVHGEYFTHLFYGRHDVRQFQLHQTSMDHLVLRYVPMNTTLHHDLDPTILEKIRERMGQGVTIEVQSCEEIPLATSGKRRFTISDVSDFGEFERR